jgi:outer membrane receptor protein involved in Fe transport
MRIDGKLSKNVYLDAGIDLESRRTRYELLIPLADNIRSEDNIDVPPELLIRNVDTLLLAAHADVAIDIDKLRLVPGLRFDSYLLNAHAQYTVDPRLVARYQLRTDFAAKGYVGVFHQPPQPEALDTEFGNPEVEPERAVHLGLGGEWNFARHWDLDFEGYFIDRRNQVTDTSAVVEDPDTGDIRRIFWENTRVGDTVGFEFLLRRQVTEDFFGWTPHAQPGRQLPSRQGLGAGGTISYVHRPTDNAGDWRNL